MRDPAERPSAWSVLTRLVRYMEQGGGSLRCDSVRQAIPLSASHATRMLEARAADARLANDAEYDDDGGRSRKRRREEGGSRRDERSHKSKHSVG